MGFWEWHRRMMRSTEPVAGFNLFKDEQGNKDYKWFIGGSKFWYTKRTEQIPTKRNKEIEPKKRKKLIEVKEPELIE